MTKLITKQCPISLGNSTSSEQHSLEHFKKHVQINIDDLNDNPAFLAEDKFVIGIHGNDAEVKKYYIDFLVQ